MNFLKVNSLSSYYLIIIWLNPIKNSNKYSIKIIQMQDQLFTESNDFLFDQISLQLPKTFNNSLKLDNKHNLTDRMMLIQKKKNYSQAIRERNLNLNSSVNLNDTKNSTTVAKFKKDEREIERQCCRNKNNLRNKSNIRSKKQNNDQQNHKKKATNRQTSLNLTATDISSLLNSKTEQFNPNKTQQLFFETSQGYHSKFNEKNPLIDIQKNRQLSLCSQTVDTCLNLVDGEKELLKKQNQTFKKDLAYFRKQSSQLNKQLEKTKNMIKQFEQLAEDILDKQKQSKCSCNYTTPHHNTQDNKDLLIFSLKQKLQELDNEYKHARLEYTLKQKKLNDQAKNQKKKMAREVGIWRQKYQSMTNQREKSQMMRDSLDN